MNLIHTHKLHPIHTRVPPQMADFWYMAHTEQGPPGRHPRFDHHYASTLGPGGAVVGQQPYYVQVGGGRWGEVGT